MGGSIIEFFTSESLVISGNLNVFQEYILILVIQNEA